MGHCGPHRIRRYKQATEAFANAIKAAQAQKVLAALMLFLQAPNGQGTLHGPGSRGAQGIPGRLPSRPADQGSLRLLTPTGQPGGKPLRHRLHAVRVKAAEMRPRLNGFDVGNLHYALLSR